MATVISFQDGVETYRRAMLDLAPARKGGIDKFLGQSEARAIRKARETGRTALLPQNDAKLTDEQKALYAYPATDGTVPLMVDNSNEFDGDFDILYSDLATLRREVAELRLGPFGGTAGS